MSLKAENIKKLMGWCLNAEHTKLNGMLTLRILIPIFRIEQGEKAKV